ncbi:MAG: TolC family protein [Pontiellaceae bacterium]|nr:TolC family protein [Pontiellaceae bacterium]MBN2786459.1 TolC family protein [Pontiellaceae bacterium]
MKYLSCYRIIRISGLILLAGVASSCTRIGNFAEKRADEAAYRNIRGAQSAGMGQADPFSVDEAEGRRIREMLEASSSAEAPMLLSLSDTLAIALSNSRSYQARKESLFIQALTLTETQKSYNWDTGDSFLYAGTEYSDNGATAETFGDNGVDGGLGLSVGRTLVSGARMSLGVTHEIVEQFTNPDTGTDSSTASFNIVQPLLNGFGPLVSREPLRLAERNMVYAVRDFRRYQQDFVIDITSLYYSTLRSRDQLLNARKNYESTMLSREQTESYAKAGRIADFEAAQARQSELNAADRWATAQASYEQALDDFRYTLGLPIDLNVEPDPDELVLLSARGLVALNITLDEAVDSALTNRLDLITQRQQVEDQERNLKIQLRNFLPSLDVSYSADYDLEASSGAGFDQDTSVRLNIPFDWTEKRNDYRIAQINLNRERRDLEQFEWDIRRDVRSLWRTLENNRSVYNNRLISVGLAERRAENTTMLLKQGKAQTRDLLEAQDDLLDAENAATLSLVDYTINRLRFWNAIERFEIDPKGMWYEQEERDVEEAIEAP